MASPRDPARSKESAPVTDPGPVFEDETFGDQAIDEEPEVSGQLMTIDEILPPVELDEAAAADLLDTSPVVNGLVAKRRTPRTVRPRRGRPRSAHADREILRAATEILEVKGVGGLSMEEVA